MKKERYGMVMANGKRVLKRFFSAALAMTTACSGGVFSGLYRMAPYVKAAEFSDSRVLALSFEGDVKDGSGRGNHGKTNGTVSYADGVNGKCLSLTGSGYLDLGTAKNLQPSEMTVSFWLKAPEGGLSGEQMIMWNKDDGCWFSDGWYLGSASDSRPLELSAGPAAEQPFKAFVSGSRAEFFPAGEWVHIVLVYSSSTKTMQVYRNGVKQVVSTEYDVETGVIGSTDAHKWLGTNSPKYGSKSVFDIDEYEIYNTAAAAEDALALYQKNGGTIDNRALLEEDFAELNIAGEITRTINLPAEGSRGGSKITWGSSDVSVISQTGAVTRPSAGEGNKTVTLTATLVNGTETKTKVFEVTVRAVNELSDLSQFAMGDVLVTDAYKANAFQKDVEYLISLDTDRLLAGFCETAAYAAGYTQKQREEFMNHAERYGGGWENSLIGGHTMGHYLTALAQASANPAIRNADKEKVDEIIHKIVSKLKECQDMTKGSKACKEGYLFGAVLKDTSNLEFQFDNVEAGRTNIFTQAWVPWYTMHKILAGLVDVYKYTGNETALEVASNLGNWVYNRVSAWSDQTQTAVLNVEYGGMNDCLYELYKLTKEEKHAQAAHKFDEISLFEKVASGAANVLDGRHANTTIPKFLGALNRYEVYGEKEEGYLEYAQSFWQMVTERHTYITGGNSEDEHFGADYVLDRERSEVNNETCNTYNMLKLSRELFKITGEKKYADYYEKTLLNAILASQNPETGMTMYFQPMETGYQKVFGTEENSFWCCTGSGMENFTKLNDSIYYYRDDMLVVNQYVSSELNWKEKHIKLVQTTDFLSSDTAAFTVSSTEAEGKGVKMYLLLPEWAAGDITVAVDGQETVYKKGEADYAVIDSEKIKDGTTIMVTVPKTVTAYNLPDSKHTYGFQYGPYVLSAKLGTQNQTTGSHGVSVKVPASKAVKNDHVSIYTADSVEDYMEHIAENMVKTEGKMEFTLKGTNLAAVFVPHYSQYQESYGIYWTFYAGDAPDTEQDDTQELFHEAKQGAVEAGYGQYEDGLIEENSVGDSTALTRYAKAGGYFQYELAVAGNREHMLLVTLDSTEESKPLKISIGGTVIYDNQTDRAGAAIVNETLSDTEKEKYSQIAVHIPETLIVQNIKNGTADNSKKVIDVRFEGSASEDSAKVCGWIYTRTLYDSESADASTDINGTNTKKKAALNKKTLSLKVGGTAKLKLKNNKKKVTWKSSKKTVAKVNKNGKVTALAKGICKITAKAGKKKYVCQVTVKNRK